MLHYFDYSDITVSHSTGPAREALSGTNSSASSLLIIGLVLFYTILSSITIRSYSVDSWKSSSRYKGIAKLIHTSKPWYFFDSEWPLTRSEVVKELLSKTEVWRDIAKHPSYQFLTIDKPNHISNAEWKEITDLAIGDLEKKYLYEINTAISASTILELLNTEKPQYFPDTKWDELEEKANLQYISLKKRYAYSQESVVNSLKEIKPKKISQAAWHDLTEYWGTQYQQNIIRDLQYTYDPFDYIEKLDLSILGDEQKADLEKYLKKFKESEVLDRENQKLLQLLVLLLEQKPLGGDKPAEIEESQWNLLKLIERRYDNLQLSEAEHNELTNLFGQLLNQQPLSNTKPEEISDLKWRWIKEVETLLIKLRDVETLGKQNQSIAIEVSQDRTQVSSIKEKLEKQLRFIHELLLDPTAIDRVEEHDNTFASGNWENLQKVARMLRKPKR